MILSADTLPRQTFMQKWGWAFIAAPFAALAAYGFLTADKPKRKPKRRWA